MPGEGQPIPRFPCLCRAIYSYGGERPNDLGFVEGDLIEAINPGDGQWWRGRLRRNKVVGEFPCNFVEVLEEYSGSVRARSPAPGSRAGSPVATRARSPAPGGYYEDGSGRGRSRAGSRMQGGYGHGYQSRGASPAPYQGQHISRAASPNPYRAASPNPYRAASPNPYTRAASPAPSGYHRAVSPNPYNRAASPNPYRAASPNPYTRAASPAPPQHSWDRAPSPNPYRAASPNPYMRAASPAPSQYRAASPAPPRHGWDRAPSPNPYGGHGYADDGPPPPPPPHRYAGRPASPMPPPHREGHLRTPTPSRPPSAMQAQTPSPLRNAMEDVMESLQHMTNFDDRPRTPADPWSPEAFGGELYPAKQQPKPRPATSMADGRQRYDDDDMDDDDVYERPVLGGSFRDRVDERLRMFEGQDQEDLEEQMLQERFEEITRPATSDPMMRHRKSAYDVRANTASPARMTRPRPLSRIDTVTTNASSHQSSSTNTSGSTALTSASIMSGMSAGGFSATSAGSLARRKQKAMSMAVLENNMSNFQRSGSPNNFSGRPRGKTWTDTDSNSGGVFGGFSTPTQKPKKTGFFKKILNSAKTSAASARSVAGSSSSKSIDQVKAIPDGINAIAGGRSTPVQNTPSDWVFVRRDVNRANSFSRNERLERAAKQQMLDLPVLSPVDALDEEVDGDEGIDGTIVTHPKDFTSADLTLVDKAARRINSLPPFTTPESLATHHVCRPYRSQLQCLRAIFIWCSEKLAYDSPTDTAPADPRQVISAKSGTPLEIATVVKGMCDAIQIPCFIIPGYLKTPHDSLLPGQIPPVTHYWNSVLLDGEYRFLDCSLASPTHPSRTLLTASTSPAADPFYFLTRPSHLCWTHVPCDPAHQHLLPPLPPDILLSLPLAAPTFFNFSLALSSYDTSLPRLEDLETLQLDILVPPHIELTATLETPVFALDNDGDSYETGEIRTTPALAQPLWENRQKTYKIKAVLPGDEGRGVLRVYAGRKGAMQSLKSNPHPLALSLPITHTGENPSYEFVVRHPTPHAQRCDLYVVQPQCRRLAVGNTYVFSVRQASADGGGDDKPAKLGIQTPSGKIVRLMRKTEGGGGEVWETVVKCGERGAWRGLVLADRSARWCVHSEWEVA